MRQNKAFRTIAASEVKRWFGKLSKAQLGCPQYRDIAANLTHMRWPSDPIDVPKSQSSSDEIQTDEYWDFKAATDAAKLLLESMPTMLRHWDSLLGGPETRAGYPTIKKLEDALVTALPYIEWPFGRYERQTGRQRPKPWHLPAVLIAKAVIKAMAEVGNNKPSFTRKSVLVRIVWQALIRMEYPDNQMITASAVAMHLTRWHEKYGLI